MLEQTYDFIIVGSGLGGASAAYRLSASGFKVLVIERGPWPYRDKDDWNAEKILLRSRYYGKSPIGIQQYGSREYKPTFMNENVGGMSVFYGGAAFRLRERDFDRWPVSYEEFSSFYDQAEKLLGVHGKAGMDPCEPRRYEDYPYEPIEFNPPAQRIFQAAQSLGLRPFPIPLAINFRSENQKQCIQCHTCDGYPCQIEAKNDATRILAQAMTHKPAPVILTGLEAEYLKWAHDRVESVQLVDRKTGKRLQLKASAFIISGGSIGSPSILLRSHLDSQFPHAKWIGKGLMRHCNAIVSYVFPFKTNPQQIFHKQIAVSDFYEDFRESTGTSTGVIQDIYTPERRVVSAFAPRGLKWLAGALSEYIQSLLCVAEDEPQDQNRVYLSDQKDEFGLQLPRIHHEYSKADYQRRDYLIAQARKILKKAGGKISRLMKIDSFSHAVGTLRFGENEKKAVLDRNCRFFGLKNLYVVDGSFMPSSGGVNPSLTITANSLRVSQHLIDNRAEWSS